MATDKAKKSIPKKKSWVEIISTKPFENQFIGETHVAEPAEKIGLKLSSSMAAITGEHSKQNLQVKYLISKFHDGRFFADLVGVFMYPSAVKKLVRRNKEKLDQSFLIKTKEGMSMRIKTVVITRGQTTHVVLAKLSKQIVFHVTKVAAARTYQDFLSQIFSRKLHKGLQDYLKKTYPIAAVEIRQFEVILGKGETVPQVTEEVVEEPKTETPATEPAPAAESAPSTHKPTHHAPAEHTPAATEEPKKKAPRAKKAKADETAPAE